MKFVTFLRKNDYHPKRVVDFPRERDTFRNKIMEIVEDFACESIFLSFFHNFSAFFPFFIFHFFAIFIFYHFSFIFFHFSFIFFHFLSLFCHFSVIFRVREFQFLLGKKCVAHSVAHSFTLLL